MGRTYDLHANDGTARTNLVRRGIGQLLVEVDELAAEGSSAALDVDGASMLCILQVGDLDVSTNVERVRRLDNLCARAGEVERQVLPIEIATGQRDGLRRREARLSDALGRIAWRQR